MASEQGWSHEALLGVYAAWYNLAVHDYEIGFD
jgi:hypothetical protein